MCNTEKESLDHLLVCCSFSKLICVHLLSWVGWWPTSESSVQGVWTAVLSSVGNNSSKEARKVIVAAFLWIMWIQRNGKVFNGIIKSAEEIVEEIQYMAFAWLRSRYKLGKFLTWESWLCNPESAFLSCNSLAPR